VAASSFLFPGLVMYLPSIAGDPGPSGKGLHSAPLPCRFGLFFDGPAEGEFQLNRWGAFLPESLGAAGGRIGHNAHRSTFHRRGSSHLRPQGGADVRQTSPRKGTRERPPGGPTRPGPGPQCSGPGQTLYRRVPVRTARTRSSAEGPRPGGPLPSSPVQSGKGCSRKRLVMRSFSPDFSKELDRGARSLPQGLIASMSSRSPMVVEQARRRASRGWSCRRRWGKEMFRAGSKGLPVMG